MHQPFLREVTYGNQTKFCTNYAQNILKNIRKSSISYTKFVQKIYASTNNINE